MIYGILNKGKKGAAARRFERAAALWNLNEFSLFRYQLPLGGSIERIQPVKPSGLRVWISTVPGPLKRQTSPSPDFRLERNPPLDAFSIS